MSILSKIRSIFSDSALAKVILRAAVSKSTQIAATAVSTVLVAHGVTVPSSVVDEIITTVVSKIEDAV